MKMKKIGKALLIGALVLSTSIPVFAQTSDLSSDSQNGGSVNLDELSTGITTFATENVGGGVWDHGFDKVFVYSNYNHPEKFHSSAVEGLWKDSDERRAGIVARSKAPRAPYGNRAFWNTY